jgi:DNA invertase Pin-like site-specific DNA recombinase
MTRRATTRAVAQAAEAGLRVAIYIRRSTDEEHQPFSLEAQENKLRAYITSQPGWSLVATFPDDASGATLDRPGLQKALAAARAGRFDVLLVYRVDRFTRRIRDLVALLDDLDTAGVAFRSATEPFDTSTAAGRMLVQMLGVFAEFEHEMIIDRVVNGMERKAAKGKWTLGTAPFGYHADSKEHVLIPDEDEAPTVKEIFHLYTSRRLGTRAIATRLNRRALSKRGGRPRSHKIVAHVLGNRVYLGEIAFRGIVRANAHDALIDPATFELAQRILTDRGETPPPKPAPPPTTTSPASSPAHGVAAHTWAPVPSAAAAPTATTPASPAAATASTTAQPPASTPTRSTRRSSPRWPTSTRPSSTRHARPSRRPAPSIATRRPGTNANSPPSTNSSPRRKRSSTPISRTTRRRRSTATSSPAASTRSPNRSGGYTTGETS